MKRLAADRRLQRLHDPTTLARSVYRSQQRRWVSTPTASRPTTALFFPGQGVQRVGMITPWLDAFPRTVRPILDEIDTILAYPLSRVISSGPNSQLSATDHAQPAIMATSILILRVLEQEFNFRPPERVHFTLGHSLGEFAALVAGGYLSFPDALRLVRHRAEVMMSCSRTAMLEGGGEYGMVALVCEPDRLTSLIESIHEFLGHSSPGAKQDSSQEVPAIQQVLIANINSRNQIVLSGKIERVQTLLTHLRQFAGHDPRAVRLRSDSPFHSPIMRPAMERMKRVLDRPSAENGQGDIITFPGHMPCVSNVSARPFQSRAELKDLLARQCVETVRWWDSIKYLDQDEKVRRWLGIGPGLVGRNLVGKEVGMKGRDDRDKSGGVWGVNDPREAEDIMKALEETEGCI